MINNTYRVMNVDTYQTWPRSNRFGAQRALEVMYDLMYRDKYSDYIVIDNEDHPIPANELRRQIEYKKRIENT